MKISDQLRAAVLAGPKTQYQLAADTGIARSVMSRFVRGEQGISLATADVLAEHLGLALVKQTRKQVKR